MQIFTIGYEGLDKRQFLALLKTNGIDTVIDVRQLPTSRKKGFSKTTLGEMLSDNGIEYVNVRDLGAPKPLRERLYQTGDYEAFFKEYGETISDKTEHFDTILEMIKTGKKVSLLCFEREPENCHRSLLSCEICRHGGNGMKIKHIVPI